MHATSNLTIFIGSEEQKLIDDAYIWSKNQSIHTYNQPHTYTMKYTNLFDRNTQQALLGPANKPWKRGLKHDDVEYLSMLLNLQLSIR
jgi:hypothetical protein